MKNKGQLVLMIVIVVFMILMLVQPWNLLKKDDTAASVSANAVSGNEASSGSEGAQEQTQQPAQQTNPASDLPPHTPANLYDIEDSDYISGGDSTGSASQQTTQSSGQESTSSESESGSEDSGDSSEGSTK